MHVTPGQRQGQLHAEGQEQANILIVDDLPEKLLVFQTVLEELGQNLVQVRSGPDALRELLKREFAVILLDVNMPGMDGFETAELIRQHPRSQFTPIIFITSYADELQTAKGYALGAVDYILSPVNPQVLRSKVSVFVSLFLMARQIRRQADGQAALLAAQAARRVAEENDRRSAYLARASRELSESLDVQRALRTCAQLLVPEIAPLAVLHLSDVHFAQVPVCVATGEAGEADEGPKLSWYAERELDAFLHKLLWRVTVSRQRSVAIADSMQQAQVRDAGLGQVRALMAVPLIVGERVLGALLVASPEHGAWDAGPAVALVEELAGRAASAFENVRLLGVLQQEVRDRMAVQEELEQADRRKDEFLAMMSHELRNPLSSIKLAVEVVRRHATPSAKVSWGLEVADRQTRQLIRLIEELLDVTRISRGKIVLKREPVDLRGVLAHSIETVQAQMQGRQQALGVRAPDGAVWVQGDEARLIQVFANLLHNASKYSGEGSAIDLAMTVQPDGFARIAVKDQGIGIEADMLAHVFELFSQGQRGLDRAQGGLGVGLTLARRLAQLHGGDISACSEGHDKGSCFTVSLPLAAQDESATHAPVLAAPAAAQGVSHAVLVVDDNQDAATALGSILEAEGHRVGTAADGQQALEQLAAFTPTVVILDIGLPLLDGYQVAQRMRQSPAGASLLLIALTGYGQTADRERANDAGFDFHFVKPADMAQLLACIGAWSPKAAAPLA